MEFVPAAAVALGVLAVVLVAAAALLPAPELGLPAFIAGAWAAILWTVHWYVSRRPRG